VITNERQYRIAVTQLAQGRELTRDGASLRDAIARYEDLRAGRVPGRRIDSLLEIPEVLIEARIAARMTQRDLAARLSVAEQQVQRWEANGFRGVGVDRLQAAADALGIHLYQSMTYDPGGVRGVTWPLLRPELCDKHIGAAYLTFADSNVRLIQSTLEEASERAGLGWSFSSADGRGTPSQARAALRSLLDGGCDLIYLEGIPPRQVEEELEQARRAGVPMIGGFTAAELDHNDDAAVLESDSVRLNLHMLDELNARSTRNESIEIALIDSTLDVIAGRRTLLETLLRLRANRRIRIVDVASVDLADPLNSSAAIADRFLADHPRLAAIWTNYPVSATAAVAAVASADRGDQVAVYGHIANEAGVRALRAPDSPMRATSWVDLDYTTYLTVGDMLGAFAGHARRRLHAPGNAVPVTVLDRSSVNAQISPDDTHWVAQGGLHRDEFVARWREQFS
jgi:ABC-type sugar transport system substrate-binding protein